MPTFWPPVRIGGLPMARSLWCGGWRIKNAISNMPVPRDVIMTKRDRQMDKVFTCFESDDNARREELVRVIEHSVERLTIAELEALYYDLVSKDYIRE